MYVIWRIDLFGHLRAEMPERAVTRFRTQKTAALLAYLAYFCERAHPREVLIEVIWPGAPPAAGRHSLRTSLSSLRHQLEPPGVQVGAVLRSDRFSIQVNPNAVRTDVADFEAALEAADAAATDSERVQFLVEAVNLYSGELLPGYYQDWILTEQRRLADLYFAAVRRLAACFERLAEPDQALPHLRRAVELDPFREAIHGDLMRFLAAAGQPSAALEHFEDLRRVFREELDTRPSAALVRLEHRIRSQRAPAVRPPSIAPAEPSACSSVGLPSSTVTFLLAEPQPVSSGARTSEDANEQSRKGPAVCLLETIERHGGCRLRKTEGCFIAAFERARDALACAIECQRSLVGRATPPEATPPVRMALDTREVKPSSDQLPGWLFRRAKGLLLAAHGGQILCSQSTTALLNGGLDPDIQLIDLGYYRLCDLDRPEPVFAVQHAELALISLPPAKALPAYAGYLPLQTTSFFGRVEELESLDALLHKPQARLVTLIGCGGCGKTRLAVEAVRQLYEEYCGAVWFVDLCNLSNPRLLADSILKVLRVPTASQIDPLELVKEVLSQQDSIVVLDNFEHLVEEGTPVVQALVRDVPELTCIVTSRRCLGLTDEREFRIGPLPMPSGEVSPEALMRCPAVELFVDRAQMVRPDFQLTAGNAEAVAELCRRLEGIPLALELAAARIQALTPEQMLGQLEQRFEFLVSRKRDAAPRHRTMRAAIDWTFEGLSPALQQCFARLSVFRGGWTAENAAVVCDNARTPRDLAQLCDESLIYAEETRRPPRVMRFHMLDTLREYADERLVPEDRTLSRRRHVDAFLTLAEEAERHLSGNDVDLWLERIEREQGNLRVALECCEANSELADQGLRLAAGLGRFWAIRGYITEGRIHLKDLLARSETSAPAHSRARALETAGNLAAEQADFEEARLLYEQSLALYRRVKDRKGVASTLNNLGLTARGSGDLKPAAAFFKKSLAIQRNLGNEHGVAACLVNLGGLALDQGDVDLARRYHEQSLEISTELGHQPGLAAALNNLGDVNRRGGDLAEARSLYTQSLSINRRLKNRDWEATNLHNLGLIASAVEDLSAAIAFFQQALTIWSQQGNRPRLACSLAKLATAFAALDQPRKAARLCGAVESLLKPVDSRGPSPERTECDDVFCGLRKVLEADLLERLREEGQSMPIEEATAHALELSQD